MNKRKAFLFLTLTLLCVNVFSSELECNLSKYQSLKDAHILYDPMSKKKLDLSYSNGEYLYFVTGLQFPLSEAPTIWNEKKLKFESDDILEFVYQNFRFQMLEEYIFMNTQLKERSESSAVDLEGKDYLISAWTPKPIYKVLHKLWISKDENHLYVIKIMQTHSTKKDAPLDETALKSEFQNFIKNCSINKYELPSASLPPNQ